MVNNHFKLSCHFYQKVKLNFLIALLDYNVLPKSVLSQRNKMYVPREAIFVFILKCTRLEMGVK